MTCPNCGAEVGATTRFCPRCGQAPQGAAAGAPAGAETQILPEGAPAPPAYGYNTDQQPAYGYTAPVPPPAPDPRSYYAPAPPPAPDPRGGYYVPAPPPVPAPEYARVGAAPLPPPAAAPTRKSHRLRNALLAVLVVGLLGLGMGGFLLYQALNKPNIPVARLVPPDVYGYVSVAAGAQGTQKAALDKLVAAFKGQPGFRAAWDKLTAQTADSSTALQAALNDCLGAGPTTPEATPGPADDLSAFLGNNVTLAVLPVSKAEISRLQQGADAGKILQPKVLAFVDLDFNPLDKRGLLRRIGQQSGTPANLPLVETYRDVEIRKLAQGSCGGSTQMPDLYLALLGGTAALSFDPAPLHGVVDRYRDGHGLDSSPAFAGLDKELPVERLGTLYLNLSGLYDALQAAIPPTAPDGSASPTLTRLDGTLALAVSAHDDGLQIDAAADTQVAGQAIGASAVPAADLLNDVPPGSWGFYAGSDLKTTAGQVLDTYRKADLTGDLNRGLAQLRTQTGVDFEQDVLPLLGGDYLVSVGGRPGDAGPVLQGMAELRLRPADTPRLAHVVDTFNQYEIRQGGTIEPVALPGTALWNPPGTALVYGLAGDRFLLTFTTAGDPATGPVWTRSALAARGHGLGTDATVQARLGHLPAHSNALLYLDLARVRTEAVEAPLDSATRASYRSDWAPFVRPLQYLLSGGTTALQNGYTHTHGVLFLGIGP